jgi:hypothetical protein
MAVLKGQAAREWIAQNPSRGFTDLRTGQRYNVQAQPQQPQESRFTNLLLGLSKPFRQGLGIAGEFGGTIEDLVATAKGRHEDVGGGFSRQLGNIFLTPEEEEFVREDPLKAGLKSGAGVASYGIGGGGLGGAVKGGTSLARIGSAAKLGALGGGLGGFGYSEEGEELGGTLKGAALGGVIGAGLQGIGEGAAALKARGAKDITKLREKALSSAGVDDVGQLNQGLSKIPDDPYLRDIELLQRGNKTPEAKEYLMALRDQGLVDPGQINMSLRDYGVEPLGQQIKPASDQATRELGLSKGAIEDLGGWKETKKFAAEFYDDAGQGLGKMNRYGRAEIHNQITNSLGDEVAGALQRTDKVIDAKSIIQKLQSNKALKLSGIDESDINAIKEVLNTYADASGQMSATQGYDFIKRIQDAAGGFARSTGDQAAKSKQLLAATRSATRDALANAAPEASDILNKWSRYLATEPDMTARVVSRAAGLNVPGTFQKVGGSGITKVADTLTYPLSARGSMGAQAATRPLSGVGTAMLGGIEKGAQLGQRAIPAAIGLGAIGAGQPSEEQFEQAYMPIQQQQQSQMPFNREELAQLVLNGQISASDANFLLKLYEPEEMKDQDLVMNVQEAISMLDQGAPAGKIPTALGKVGEFFGAAGEGTDYRALISDIRTKIINQIAGTAQTPQEMKNLIDRLPKSTDEPAVAKRKLEVLLRSLSRESGGTMQEDSIVDQYQY